MATQTIPAVVADNERIESEWGNLVRAVAQEVLGSVTKGAVLVGDADRSFIEVKPSDNIAGNAVLIQNKVTNVASWRDDQGLTASATTPRSLFVVTGANSVVELTFSATGKEYFEMDNGTARKLTRDQLVQELIPVGTSRPANVGANQLWIRRTN